MQKSVLQYNVKKCAQYKRGPGVLRGALSVLRVSKLVTIGYKINRYNIEGCDTMNIIRTTAVELNTIPAIAYKMKLSAGGAGVKLFRLDQSATAVVTVDRRTGEGVPYGKIDDALFPEEAINEAIELTCGLPYSARGKLNVTVFEEKKEDEDVEETESEKIDMVDSDEYRAIVERYTDEKGKINYALMNKDFIQFASKSKILSDLVADKLPAEELLVYVVKNRAGHIAGKKDSLTDDETRALIETLDEIDPRSAFKELSAHLRRMLSRAK